MSHADDAFAESLDPYWDEPWLEEEQDYLETKQSTQTRKRHNMIAPGTYTAVVVETETDSGPVKVQFGEAGTGTKQVAVNLQVADDSPAAGQTIMWFGYATKDSVTRTLQSLRYMGWKGDDIADINNQPLDQAVQIVIEHSEYNGKVQAKVAWVNSPGAGKGFQLAKRLDGAALGKFAATIKAHAKKVPEVSSSAPAPRTQSGVQDTPDNTKGPADDDLAF